MAATGFCLLAVFGALTLLYAVGILNGKQSEKRYQQRHSHAEAAKRQAQRACDGADPSTVFECAYEFVERSEDTAQTEQDLTAQQRAAWAALVGAGIALLTMIVTAIGVWFVKRTLDATLEAVKDTSKATDAMIRQNEISERAQRPWITVSIQPVTMSPEKDEREFIFDAVFKNIGQSATEFHASCERFHPALREEIQGPAVEREVPDRGIPILPNEEIALRYRVIFSKEPMFLVPWVLATVIYRGENRRCVGSYVFRIERKVTAGIQVWGGALIGPDEHALTDQIDPKREHGLTRIV